MVHRGLGGGGAGLPRCGRLAGHRGLARVPGRCGEQPSLATAANPDQECRAVGGCLDLSRWVVGCAESFANPMQSVGDRWRGLRHHTRPETLRARRDHWGPEVALRPGGLPRHYQERRQSRPGLLGRRLRSAHPLRQRSLLARHRRGDRAAHSRLRRQRIHRPEAGTRARCFGPVPSGHDARRGLQGPSDHGHAAGRRPGPGGSGPGAGLQHSHRKTGVALQHHPSARRGGPRDLAA